MGPVLSGQCIGVHTSQCMQKGVGTILVEVKAADSRDWARTLTTLHTVCVCCSSVQQGAAIRQKLPMALCAQTCANLRV